MMTTNYSVGNGDGTIVYMGMTEAQARSRAQELADRHGEPFTVTAEVTGEDVATFEPSENDE